MKKSHTEFCYHSRYTRAMVTGAIAALFLSGVANAAVVQRTTASRAPTRANNAAARAVVTSAPAAQAQPAATVSEPVAEPQPTVVTPAPVDTPDIVITDKSSQFETSLGNASASATDTSADARAEMIRRQRAALDSAAQTSAATSAVSAGRSTCDASLRKCMQEKCGTDFTKCSGDTDTTWGGKMDACRRDLDCSGTEYRLFATEIKADRDLNAQIASYNNIVNCGNQYNNCIVTECGTDFSKCLGRTAGDAAISKCEKIARNCTQADSGLASRIMGVFGTLRQHAEIRVKQDEERLYELRDLMREQCERLGAMFDDRTLDCVYTVNFFADNNSTPYASKKVYAGGTFDCTPNWFGVDITTFMENAMRLTRGQAAASSTMMGAGAGMAVGAITSGAINRAIDRHTAETALKDATAESTETSDTTDATETQGTDATTVSNTTAAIETQDTDTRSNTERMDDYHTQMQQAVAQGKSASSVAAPSLKTEIKGLDVKSVTPPEKIDIKIQPTTPTTSGAAATQPTKTFGTPASQNRIMTEMEPL